MRVLKSSIFWGMVLIIAGGLLFLEALDVLGTSLIWSAILGAAGAAFIYTFFKSRDLYWWAAIPEFGLAAATAWDQLGPASLEEVSGALFLGGAGVGFLAVYLVAGREHWWALIVGGLYLSFAPSAALAGNPGHMGEPVGGGGCVAGEGPVGQQRCCGFALLAR